MTAGPMYTGGSVEALDGFPRKPLLQEIHRRSDAEEQNERDAVLPVPQQLYKLGEKVAVESLRIIECNDHLPQLPFNDKVLRRAFKLEPEPEESGMKMRSGLQLALCFASCSAVLL
ncbi:hypothetical protein KC326_g17 [Hortaea werneckii]|nr:hypothetical protein KC326_g17 [Hortaea werneckii]